MKHIKLLLPFILLLNSALLAFGTSGRTLDLSGTWHFALDPVDQGEKTDWHAPVEGWDGARPHPAVRWDEVDVPHDFLSDPRYEYTGTAWYRRSVHIPDHADENLTWRLKFSTVFHRCRVWVNGALVGEHEGG